MKNKVAVVLLNLGGPDSLEAVEPFLYNLFCDPDIFKIPIGQKLFALIISKTRSLKIIEQYKKIGGKSPINEWTEKQRKILESKLTSNPYFDFSVFTAMRYWNPLISKTANNVKSENFSRIVLLPLYPHYSITTTGSSFNEWNRYYNGDKSKLYFVNNYCENELYIKALNEKIDASLIKFPEPVRNDIQLVFSAHGTPVSLVHSGDPYNIHIQKTVKSVMEARNYSHKHHLCYQSKVGPVKWLGPATDRKIEELAEKGFQDLLIIPISFVSDHIETLFELNIEYREVAEKAGIKNFIVMEGLNDSKTFISALAEETNNILRKQKSNE
jgi:ferrochelatase